MATLIINGTVVNEDLSYEADVYVENGVITKIGKNLDIVDGTTIIDASGKLIIPGGIDTGTKLGYQDSVDDFCSGTQAAVAGGTTFLFNFVEANPDSMVEAFEKSLYLAKSEACCDFNLQVEIKAFTSKTEEQMCKLIQRGVNSFKVSLAQEELSNPDLLKIFTLCSKLGVLAVIHAENGDIIKYNQQKLLDVGITGPEGHLFSRPEEVESEATNRAIVLARTCDTPIMIANLTSKPAAKIIAKNREQGIQVFGQPIVAALALDGKNYLNTDWSRAAAHIMSPPLRLDSDTPTRLLQMLANGVLQVTGSDTCTYNISQREAGIEDFTKIPEGVNGLESRMSIIWDKAVKSGFMSSNQFVAITSTNAAKIFNLYPRKGVIAVGSDADVIVWNPKKSHTITSKSHLLKVEYNIYEGMELHGTPDYVFVKGKLVVEKEKMNFISGSGEFVSTAPFSPYVFSRLKVQKLIPIQRVKTETPKAVEEEIKKEPPKEFHPRPLTRAGGRNLQDSTFSLSGTQVDENVGRSTGVKEIKPFEKAKTSLW